LIRDQHRLRTLLRGADGLLAMSGEILQWALRKARRRPAAWDRVFYLGYPDARQGNSKQPPPDAWPNALQDRLQGKKILLFVGTFGRSYELSLLVRAARLLAAKGQTEEIFVLAGTGEQFETLQKETAGLPNVVLTGWLNAAEIQTLLDRAWAGMVPCRSVSGAMPNKVFEYLSAGVPLISSLEGEMAQHIERHGLGFSYRPGDLEELCGRIETILDRSDLQHTMSVNARHFYEANGRAETIYPAYADLIEKLVAAHGRRPSI
jgi:glycosyltransferase involved in cell wall biosynthesis